jgi:hypothetical protein
MSKLLRILTAAVLTVHLTMGCCLHHAHACESTNCTLPATAASSHDSHCHDSPSNDSDHSKHGPQKCKGEKCSFVPPSLTASHSLTQPLQGFVITLIEETTSPKGIVAEQNFFATGRLPLPLRLHLANQVLLI